MSDTKTESPKKAVPAADLVKKEEKRKSGKPRNYDLGNGVYRFSRSRMYHKKAIYKFIDKKTPKIVKTKRPLTIEKEIGGDKNGEKRIVPLKKRSYYPTADPISKKHAKKYFREHRRYLRPSLVPGTICILLAGSHKGKRVVFLKQLKSGLLLVTGPFLINGCPMRRINQNYVIATSTRIDLTGFKLPEHIINDEYFKRKLDKRAKKEEGDIFSKKTEEYKPTEQRKNDQKVVDKFIINKIKQNRDKKLLFTYLSAMFGLRSSQYPHRLQF